MIGKLNEEQARRILENNVIGHLACCENNKPYVVPLSYIYDNGFIIAHSEAGKKIRMMRNNSSVCFQVNEVDNYTSWRSVIVFGEFEEITDEDEQYRTLKLFVERTMHLKISETAIPPEITPHRVHPRSPGYIKPVVYRIAVKEISGKFESPADSF
jgi:nitroimidazol reductase NimA-like FMN-containing flavoprotein (pyridoxamine 5'-phosphate oxidase superfamily)